MAYLRHTVWGWIYLRCGIVVWKCRFARQWRKCMQAELYNWPEQIAVSMNCDHVHLSTFRIISQLLRWTWPGMVSASRDVSPCHMHYTPTEPCLSWICQVIESIRPLYLNSLMDLSSTTRSKHWRYRPVAIVKSPSSIRLCSLVSRKHETCFLSQKYMQFFFAETIYETIKFSGRRRNVVLWSIPLRRYFAVSQVTRSKLIVSPICRVLRAYDRMLFSASITDLNGYVHDVSYFRVLVDDGSMKLCSSSVPIPSQ